MDWTYRFRLVLALALLTIMWIASIAREPGGVEAFDERLVALEQQIVPRSPEGLLEFSTTTTETGKSGKKAVMYPGGVVCEEDAATGQIVGDMCLNEGP
jgi:hypothetical protein